MIFARFTRARGLCALFAILTLVMFLLLPLVVLWSALLEGDFWSALSAYGAYHAGLLGGGQMTEVFEILVWHMTPSVILAAVQVVFLAPLVGPVRSDSQGRSMRASMLSAACVALVLSCGIVFALFEVVALVSTEGVSASLVEDDPVIAPFALFIGWGIIGLPWTIALWKVGDSRHPNGLARATRMLLAGTVIELVLALPIYVLARRRESCYCSLSSWWAMVAGIVALLSLCGPCAVLFLTREARRNWSRGACHACGYPRRSGAVQCSECGHAFTSA